MSASKGKLIQFDPTVKPKKAPKPPEITVSWSVQGYPDLNFQDPVAIAQAGLTGDVLSAVEQMLSRSDLHITAIMIIKE